MKPTTVTVHVPEVPVLSTVCKRILKGWNVLSVGLMPTMSETPLLRLSRLEALMTAYPVLLRIASHTALSDE